MFSSSGDRMVGADALDRGVPEDEDKEEDEDEEEDDEEQREDDEDVEDQGEGYSE